MRSATPTSGYPPADVDDRTTRARIRDAAIEVLAHEGPGAITARRVARAAGVSPGNVIHHFGTMTELRRECDAHVAAFIRDTKTAALTSGRDIDILGILRGQGSATLLRYLAHTLNDASDAVSVFIDELVDDARTYLQDGAAAGTVRPSSDMRSRAAILTVWSLGALVLHEHVNRLLGVDLTDPDIDPDSLFAYLRPASEILASGVLTDEFAARLGAALSPDTKGDNGS